MTILRSRVFATPLGPMSATLDGTGALVRLDFDADRPGSETPEPKDDDEALAAIGRQLEEYFAGARRTFDVVLAPQGTQFEERVWRTLVDIPYGTTISYRELAALVGKPNAFRAVGLANGRNPIAIVVPCHRVIGADGSLTGYGGGLERKRQLLELEGALKQPALL